MTTTRLALLAAATVGWGGAACAQQAGDNVLGVGWFHLAPQDSSTPLRLVSPQSREIPNTGSNVAKTNTLALTYERFLTDNVAAELVMGLPPRFHLDGRGALASVGELGSAKQWSPAVLVKYHFGQPQQTFRPFLGLGVSYFWYTDVSLTDPFQQRISNLFTQNQFGGARTDASIDRKWAPVFNAGAAYKLNKSWSIGGSVSYVPMKTKARLTTHLPGGAVARSESSLKLNPIVVLLGVNYTF